MSNAIGNNGGRLYSFASQPVLIDCNFVVDSTNVNGLGVSALKGQGVKNVYMHTTQTPMKGFGQTIVNPFSSASSVGYALIQLRANFNRYLGRFSGAVAPVSGGAINIDSVSAALTVGKPYIISSVGAGPAGAATIAPVADVAGSLASKYFMLYDSYGNSFCIWFSVSGVGAPPLLGPAAAYGQRGLQYVQQSILSGATAAQIGAALVLTIQNLPNPVIGGFSFTASGTTTVTVTSTIAQPLGGIPQDGTKAIPEQGPAVPITFTVTSANATAGAIYTDGSGHLYSVSATIASATTLVTSGVGTPIGATLTKVSGTGDASIAFSSAVTGWATGFAFALTVSDTNLADWQAVGLLPGLLPTVGQSFVAKATGAGSSTGQVKVAGVSGISSVEVVGDPNLTFAPQPMGGSAYRGAWILVQFLAPSFAGSALATHTHNFIVIGGQVASTTNDIANYAGPLLGKQEAANATYLGSASATNGGVVAASAGTPAGVMSMVPIAPVDGSVIGMSFYVDEKFSPSNISSH